MSGKDVAIAVYTHGNFQGERVEKTEQILVAGRAVPAAMDLGIQKDGEPIDSYTVENLLYFG